jgi:hypothetical protein
VGSPGDFDPSRGAPPPPPQGTSTFIWVLALVGLGGTLCIGAVFAWGIYRGVTRANELAPPAASVKLPAAERHVPHHALTVFEGCSDGDVQLLASGIDGAIEVGAPLYNAGNFAGCYHLYEGTAADIERRLGGSCVGPAQALEAGRTRAASLTGASAQAWAMRDAFDGLADAMERRRAKP